MNAALPLTLSSGICLYFIRGKMCTLLPVRNFSKLAMILERNISVLTVVNSQLHSRILVQTRGSLEYFTPKIHNPNVMLCRYMAKAKDKVKKGGTKMRIDERELSKHFDLEKLYGDFNSPLDHFRKLLVEQATVRTSANVVEQLKVKYQGDTYAIQDLAEVGKKGGKEIILDMGAFSDALPIVMDVLRNSSLGLNPNQQGSAIIVPLPKVTREHRETLVKGAKSLFNKCKDNIRNIQNKYISRANNIEGVSDDDIFRLKGQFTEIGNIYISKAEEMYKIKEKELLSTD